MATFTNTSKNITVLITTGMAMGVLGLTYPEDIIQYPTFTPNSKASSASFEYSFKSGGGTVWSLLTESWDDTDEVWGSFESVAWTSTSKS